MGDQFLLTLANIIFHRPDEVIVREALEEEAALRRPVLVVCGPVEASLGVLRNWTPIMRGATPEGYAHKEVVRESRGMVFQVLTSQYQVGILLLRLFFGGLLATHGYPKLSSMRKTTQDWLAGMKLPRVLGLLIGILELFGGVFLALGFLTPIVAFLFVLQFLGILVERKRLGKKSLSDYEKDLMYLGGALALLFLGGGTYSIDYPLGL